MRFLVGKSYWANDRGYGAVKVVKRTPCFIYVENDSGSQWRMRIRADKNGIELATDSSVPHGWRGAFTYSADDIEKGE
jgi:hypothetical protein